VNLLVYFRSLIVNFNLIYIYFQDTHNQAGIAYNGGLVPLLKLLDSKNGSLQHNAAFALYGVADNEVDHDFFQKEVIFLKSLFSTAGQKLHISCSFERDQLIWNLLFFLPKAARETPSAQKILLI
jgi:hypothetical protein